MYHAETYAQSYFARLEQCAGLTKKLADQDVFVSEDSFSIKVFFLRQELTCTSHFELSKSRETRAVFRMLSNIFHGAFRKNN